MRRRGTNTDTGRGAMVVTTIKLEPGAIAALDAIARMERRSRSFLLRDAVALFLALRERRATA